MFQMVIAAAAASGAGTDESGVAIIGAIGALLVAVLGALGVYIKYVGDRADRLNEARVTDAVSGEEQLRKERDEARQQTADAYKERDKWMNLWAEESARANRLETRVTVLETRLAIQDPNAGGA
jgi:threonine dehydrogenase-like Zn-dependent dehydrogenase